MTSCDIMWKLPLYECQYDIGHSLYISDRLKFLNTFKQVAIDCSVITTEVLIRVPEKDEIQKIKA